MFLCFFFFFLSLFILTCFVLKTAFSDEEVLKLYSNTKMTIPVAPKNMKNKGFHLQQTWFLGSKHTVFDGFWGPW